MTIKLEKKEELDGELWYNVWVGNTCVRCFAHDKQKPSHENNALELATEYYDSLVEKSKSGYPKATTVSEYKIEGT